MNQERVRLIDQEIHTARPRSGPVAYWMSRDQRVRDNWAIFFAQSLAQSKRQPLCVIFVLVPGFMGAGPRQFSFMLRGLQELERRLSDLKIPFFLLRGPAKNSVPSFVEEHGVSALVVDYDPLRSKQEMLENVSQEINIPLFQVDAHNIVPTWTASSKQEWSARTFRPKIHRLLPAFLEEIPAPSVQDIAWKGDTDNDWQAAMLAGTAGIDLNDANSWTPPPGEEAAISTLLDFAANRLEAYETARNDPGKQGQSGLSPYLHFGQIAAQRAAIEVISRRNTSEATDRSAGAFLEELIVRRELSENFCRYNPHYDSVIGFPQWARTTLDEHRDDPRDYVYSMKELENAATHDEIWNAAQTEMVITGKMHGYLRMYWAKKILEWSPSPDAALFAVIELNDRHELDGRDPNGYAGAAWSVGGVHDRAFARRAVFGKIRYMSGGGLRRKFDMKAYLRRIEQLLQ